MPSKYSIAAVCIFGETKWCLSRKGRVWIEKKESYLARRKYEARNSNREK
jgi:hypothetical protein